MVKKQRIFWMDDSDYNKLLKKIDNEGLNGKGRLERFMEKIARESIIFIKGNGVLRVSVITE